MISVEWFDNETCENCGHQSPHCAELDLQKHLENVGGFDHTVIALQMKLCSNCVADLIKRLQ